MKTETNEFEGHTPGQWKSNCWLSKSGRPPLHAEVTAGARHIAEVRFYEPCDEVNARLIAAAPTLLRERNEARAQIVAACRQRDALLAALKEFRHADGCFCEASFVGPGSGHPSHSPECQSACAAVALAEKGRL